MVSFEGLHLTTSEANMAASAYTMEEMVVDQRLEHMPRFIQKLVFIDRVGLPYFRPKYK